MFFSMLVCAAVLAFLLYSESKNIFSPLKYIFKSPDKIDFNSPNPIVVNEEDWVEVTGAETQFFVVDFTKETEKAQRFSTYKNVTDVQFRYSVLMARSDPMIKKWEPVSSVAGKIININPGSVTSQYGSEAEKYLSTVTGLNKNIELFTSCSPDRFAIIRRYSKSTSYNKHRDGFRLDLPGHMNFAAVKTDFKQSVINNIQKAGEINSSMNVNAKIRGIVEKIPEDVKQQYKSWLGKDPQFSILADETPKWRKLFTVPLLLMILIFVLRKMFRNISWPREFFRPPGY